MDYSNDFFSNGLNEYNNNQMGVMKKIEIPPRYHFDVPIPPMNNDDIPPFVERDAADPVQQPPPDIEVQLLLALGEAGYAGDQHNINPGVEHPNPQGQFQFDPNQAGMNPMPHPQGQQQFDLYQAGAVQGQHNINQGPLPIDHNNWGPMNEAAPVPIHYNVDAAANLPPAFPLYNKTHDLVDETSGFLRYHEEELPTHPMLVYRSPNDPAHIAHSLHAFRILLTDLLLLTYLRRDSHFLAPINERIFTAHPAWRSIFITLWTEELTLLSLLPEEDRPATPTTEMFTRVAEAMGLSTADIIDYIQRYLSQLTFYNPGNTHHILLRDFTRNGPKILATRFLRDAELISNGMLLDNVVMEPGFAPAAKWVNKRDLVGFVKELERSFFTEVKTVMADDGRVEVVSVVFKEGVLLPLERGGHEWVGSVVREELPELDVV